MSDAKDGFLAGVILATIVIVCLNSLPWSYRTMAAKAIADCEKTLPRDHECVITAIPEVQTP